MLTDGADRRSGPNWRGSCQFSPAGHARTADHSQPNDFVSRPRKNGLAPSVREERGDDPMKEIVLGYEAGIEVEVPHHCGENQSAPHDGVDPIGW